MYQQPPHLFSLPLRTRLTLAYIGLCAAALCVLGAGLYWFVRNSLLSSIDSELETTAQILQQNFAGSNEALLEFYADRTRLTPPLSIGDFTETSLYVKVYDDRRMVQAESMNMSSKLEDWVVVSEDDFVTALRGTPVTLTTNRGYVAMRERVTPLYFRGQPVGVLQVARPMRELDRTLKLLLTALVGGGALTLLIVARGGSWLTRRAFRPIDEVTTTARSIVRAEDLSVRVPVPAEQDELQRLTITINDMLGRMDTLFSAQQRFVADVSHELRTPLAAMQGNLEVLERGASRNPELLHESLSDMRREVSRLIRMVNDLLVLARSEAGQQLRYDPVELDSLLLEVHRELRPLAGDVHLLLGEEDQVTIAGDRDRIKQALLNLGINALQHTAPGGRVVLGLHAADGTAQIIVHDTGSGIPADDLPHIFDRFYRSDRARTRNSGGAGLGLAIVKWVADAHGGRVLVESESGRGSTFTLELPRGIIPAPEPQNIAVPRPVQV